MGQDFFVSPCNFDFLRSEKGVADETHGRSIHWKDVETNLNRIPLMSLSLIPSYQNSLRTDKGYFSQNFRLLYHLG